MQDAVHGIMQHSMAADTEPSMTKRQPTFLMLIAAMALTTGTTAQAAESLSLPKAELHFVPSGIDPIMVAPAMGDMTKPGMHANYIRIPGKFASPPHTHSEDYFAVVVSGTTANGAPGATDIPLEPGSYWYQKGKEEHVTKCISDEPCTFFVVQPGVFDFLMK
jgi:beta-alanine degradation protein BauB